MSIFISTSRLPMLCVKSVDSPANAPALCIDKNGFESSREI